MIRFATTKQSCFRRHFVINASLSSLLKVIPEPSVTSQVYSNVPLWDISPKSRGDLLEEWAKSQDPTASDALDNTRCVNGTRRSGKNTSYDFLSNGGTRVEIKSSSLKWNNTHLTFFLQFCGIKTCNDEVRLVTYTPRGLYLHRSNGKFTSTAGIKTSLSGKLISISAPSKTYDWKEALDNILDKDWGTQMTFVTWEEFYETMQPPTSLSTEVFRGLPLSNLQYATRAVSLVKWIRRFDDETSDPVGRSTQQFGTGMSYNYLSNGSRVKVKCAQMHFNPYHQRWLFEFTGIMASHFDELRLVLYTPAGIYVYLHNGTFGLTSNGKITEELGEMRIQVLGPRNVTCWQHALEHILRKPFGTLLIRCMF